uniref:Secreted protein n=1 Tax=Octopus bimaculoides TaxID=37653 RepID=A0A0L8FL28_OCTBM
MNHSRRLSPVLQLLLNSMSTLIKQAYAQRHVSRSYFAPPTHRSNSKSQTALFNVYWHFLSFFFL